MYKKVKASRTSLNINKSYLGETIEQKVERIVNNKEPISDGAPLIYTERKDGVNPATDIRTDRFEVAIDAMDKVTKSKIAKREERLKPIKGGKDENGGDGGKDGKGGDGGEPTSLQGTETK